MEGSGLICVVCVLVYVCACMCGDPGSPLLLSPIISPCIDDSIHICSAFLRGQEVTRASYARMTRQDFFCAPSHPHTSTHRLTHCSLAEAQSVSTPPLLPSLLSPSACDLMWMDADAGGLSATLLSPINSNSDQAKEGEKKGWRWERRICLEHWNGPSDDRKPIDFKKWIRAM